MVKVEEVIFTDKERIEKEVKKVSKKIKDFESDLKVFKNSLLKADNVYDVVRVGNSFRKVANLLVIKKYFGRLI